MRKLLCILLAVLLLTGCTTDAEPSSADNTTAPTDEVITSTPAPETVPETLPLAESLPVETTTAPTAPVTATSPVVPDHFDLTDEDILLTEENSPDAVGGYVRCPLGYLVNFHEAHNPEGYLIVEGIDPEALFTVVGVTYITDASCSPSTELESIPPVTREDFISAPHYEPPEDPTNIYDFDYFAYLGAVIPISHGANAFLLIQETEISQVYCVPPALLEFVGY